MGQLRIFAADFENTTEQADAGKTYVYGAGIMEMGEDEPHIFDTIEEFFQYLENLTKEPGKIRIYFHNLKYDGMIILYHLLTNGYNWGEKGKYGIEGIVTDDRQIYQIKIRMMRKTIEIRDSLKLLNGKLEKIGEDLKCPTAKLTGTIDYDKIREPGYRMDETERRYLAADVKLLTEILQHCMTMGLLDYMTAGAFAFANLKESLYQDIHRLTDEEMQERKILPFYKRYLQETFRDVFPELPVYIDNMIRKAYRGGYCINLSDGQPYEGQGVVLDVNSLYPSCMYHHYYPYGREEYFAGDNIPEGCRTYFVHIFTRFSLKADGLPFLQLKNSFRFAENEYIKDSTDDELEFWMCSVDFETFKENYNIQYLEIVEGFAFKSRIDLFDSFVSKHYEKKKNAPDPTTKQAAKINLNSAYGKLGSRINRTKGIPYIGEDGVIHMTAEETDDYPSSTYIPAACFVTAYGRQRIIREARKNLANVMYIDTDSLHMVKMTKEKAEEMYDIDKKELGLLDCETIFTAGRWLRQKTYIEERAEGTYDPKKEGKYNLKACGLTEDGKRQYLEIYKGKEIEGFARGLELEDVRLQQCATVGGVFLRKTSFKIK